ncbi:nickel pincer cofactor biosynthesis protein LarC [Kushneria phosphatilytica]|uniref:nickel pincer cofactor biosynthesis protein LarC n=1 Tax=Kushneria phosphatilytica TaxID=657387 RepID=UPI0008D8E523|nr:nickel pincer cofactor biosynthesis protein LarC [Kushneria phosphatilytica]OHV07664.1 TIGR00299 family protein [Kushneria phosphatilytica]
MNRLHLDCTFGIAGDMLLAALIDLGADIDRIRHDLQTLPLDPFELGSERVDRCGISARLLNISLGRHEHEHEHEHEHSHHHGHAHAHPHRRAGDILAMLGSADLPPRVQQRAQALFTAIAEAEGRIHGIDPAEVHLHEVGAMDSIIDILGVCLALEQLEIDTLTASPVPVGHGVVSMAHGRFPIPAPATLELLRHIPLSDFDAPGELTTPTGAAFLQVLVERFGTLPAGAPTRIGYGAGSRNFDHPNVLRAVLFEQSQATTSPRESIAVLECQLDDATGEQLGYALSLLLEAGALDVFHTPVTMKKSRPGILITVLARPADAEALERLLLRHTSTFGVRRHDASRQTLERRIETVTTPLGKARIKVGLLEGQILRTTAEFEDIQRLAHQHDLSFEDIRTLILESWRLGPKPSVADI